MYNDECEPVSGELQTPRFFSSWRDAPLSKEQAEIGLFPYTVPARIWLGLGLLAGACYGYSLISVIYFFAFLFLIRSSVLEPRRYPLRARRSIHRGNVLLVVLCSPRSPSYGRSWGGSTSPTTCTLLVLVSNLVTNRVAGLLPISVLALNFPFHDHVVRYRTNLSVLRDDLPSHCCGVRGPSSSLSPFPMGAAAQTNASRSSGSWRSLVDAPRLLHVHRSNCRPSILTSLGAPLPARHSGLLRWPSTCALTRAWRARTLALVLASTAVLAAALAIVPTNLGFQLIRGR